MVTLYVYQYQNIIISAICFIHAVLILLTAVIFMFTRLFFGFYQWFIWRQLLVMLLEFSLHFW